MAEKSYGAKDLTLLEGLEAVRLRPGMYIGTTGINGLHHILWEIVDNAVDEAANKFATEISVTLKSDGSCVVRDNGRGIPVDKHPKLKMTGVEMVFTKLHAGGKFDNENYSYSGGLHGVGAAVTNALSRWVEVTVFMGKSQHKIRFESQDTGKKVKCGIPVTPLVETKTNKVEKGTQVHFLPDSRVFKECVFVHRTVANRLRELAFLNKGIKFTFTDERITDEYSEVSVKEFKYDGGLEDFIKFQNEGRQVLFDKPIYFQGEKDGILCEGVIQYTDSYGESIFSFVNNIPTSEGGTHETGFKSGITKVLNDYARRNNYLKDKDNNYLGDDFRVGMTAIISVRMKEIQFEGQTKTKLGNPEAKFAIDGIVTANMPAVFDKKGMGKTMEVIMKKTADSANEREKVKKAKEIARAKNGLDSFYLVGKLSACTGRNAVANELFIVEGDSAGGTAKQGRDRKTQAILPLRGKPLNVEKNKIEKVLNNEEIRTIISALGTGIKEDFNIADLKYHKVIILSDADQDGLHIRSILLTFFYRYMRELIREGKVYIGQPPLYKISKGKQVRYAFNEVELNKHTEELGRGYAVQRYKGLGEMNPSQLKETTMDKEKRVLIRVGIDDAIEAERMINILMGDSLEERKKYISEFSNFNKVDNFKQAKK